MIEHHLYEDRSLLHVRPTGPLEKEDFAALAATADPFIERTGGLHGLLIETARFPGWEDLGAVAAHVRFVRDHHRRIGKVALVTDSPLGDAAERIASHFVAAEIRHFQAGEVDAARAWIEA